MSLQLKPTTTALQKVIQLVALRQIIPPPTGIIAFVFLLFLFLRIMKNILIDINVAMHDMLVFGMK